MTERSNVLNLDGNAAGQISYRLAELPFPLIGCGSGDWGAKVRDQALSKGWNKCAESRWKRCRVGKLQTS
jgi:hypothetical protein